MPPFGTEKGNLRPQRESILPKTKQELQVGEGAHEVGSKALPQKKRRRQGESLRNILEETAKATGCL